MINYCPNYNANCFVSCTMNGNSFLNSLNVKINFLQMPWVVVSLQFKKKFETKSLFCLTHVVVARLHWFSSGKRLTGKYFGAKIDRITRSVGQLWNRQQTLLFFHDLLFAWSLRHFSIVTLSFFEFRARRLNKIQLMGV